MTVKKSKFLSFLEVMVWSVLTFRDCQRIAGNVEAFAMGWQ